MKPLTALVLSLSLCAAALAAPKPPPPPAAVEQGRDGKLTYAQSERGDRIVDFSYCGYMAADEPIPDVPVRVVVPARDGDSTERIQRAIDYVASLTADERGIRGAVLLAAGRHEVHGGLRISAAGVVLRGSGMGEGGTTLFAAGHDRRTLITIEGKNDRTIDARPIEISDNYVPVHAMRVRLSNAGTLKPGDRIVIHRPCTQEWIKALGMDYMGGDRHGYTWRPGSRELAWDRTITKVHGDEIIFDAPLTTAIEKDFGGGTVAKYEWPGRIRQVGVENIRCESAFDPQNPKDENHSWFAITMENAADAWVRQVTFSHFAGSAVAVFETCKRVTVEDCKSLSPVSEIGGWRRNAFHTAGEQTLFQRLYSEQAVHDFSVGYCAPGPNAFVQCESSQSFWDSGPINSWAAGVLFDNVRIDGNAITFGDRRFDAAGAGWSAANSVLWQCHAAVIRCFAPPTANNWALGCWATFDGDGMWQQSNESIRPTSLYYAQLAERIGPKQAEQRAQIMMETSDASSSPSIEQAAEMTQQARVAAPVMSEWIDAAAQRSPIPVDPGNAISIDERAVPAVDVMRESHPISIRDGLVVRDGKLLVGGRQNVMWWRGTMRPNEVERVNSPAVTRYAPGRYGPAWTDDLDLLTDSMLQRGQVALEHNYGLWYDRRRDDHERVRRMTGDAWPPFYEQPFARSGKGVAWDGLSRYDLTKYNPWYWDRLKQFSDLADQKGLVLIQQHYFQHNILEAGAHYADFPWRAANNINDTGFPEPPNYAGDKRIFFAEMFYDVTHPTRRELHRKFIRQSLDNFKKNTNVIHLTSGEFTGPLHFVEFWLDTIAEWERETGKNALVGLSTTKDVQDAILADATRSKVVEIIDIRYWTPREDGEPYAPEGGQNLAPRQHARQSKNGGGNSAQAVERAIREYRKKFPDKAVIYSSAGADKLGEAVRRAGGSLAEVRP